MEEIDIWRMAQATIERYGPEALPHAHQRVEEMFAHDDALGATFWLRTRHAIEELLRTRPGIGEVVH